MKSKYAEWGSNYAERAILQHLEYWWPKARTMRDGQRWLVRTIEELISGGVEASRSTIKRALIRLQSDGRIVVEVHAHPFRAGSVRGLWIRPDEPLLNLCSGPKWTFAEPLLNLCSEGNSKQEAEMNRKHLVRVAHDDDQAGVISRAEAHRLKMQAKSGITAGMASLLPKDELGWLQYPKLGKPQDLHRLLCDAAVSAKHPAPGAFNPQRGAQLKTFAKRVSEINFMTPEEMVKLVFHTCRQWAGFRAWMETTFNAHIGQSPNHGTFAKYAPELVQYWQKSGTAKKVDVGAGSSFDEDW